MPNDESIRLCQAPRPYTVRESDLQSLLGGPQITLSKPLGEANTLHCLHTPSPVTGVSQEARFIHPAHSNIDKAPADYAARDATTPTEY